VQTYISNYVPVAVLENIRIGYESFGGMGWMLGLMTGKSSGVSTVAVLVLTFPILPRRFLSLTSKIIHADLSR
jgi:hypothetical protein